MNRTMCVSTAVREMQSQIKKCALNAVKKTLKNADKDIIRIEKTKSKELLKEKGCSGNNETKKDYVQSAESVLSIMERKCVGAAETNIKSMIKNEGSGKEDYHKFFVEMESTAINVVSHCAMVRVCARNVIVKA